MKDLPAAGIVLVWAEALGIFRPMKPTFYTFNVLAVFSGLLVLPALNGSAQVFTLDPEQSLITISGTVVGGAITNQGPGSLTTKFGGTIRLTVSGDSLQFTGQSRL